MRILKQICSLFFTFQAVLGMQWWPIKLKCQVSVRPSFLWGELTESLDMRKVKMKTSYRIVGQMDSEWCFTGSIYWSLVKEVFRI